MQAPSAPEQAPVIANGQRSAPSATEMYNAAKLARRELASQVDRLQDERRELQQQLRSTNNSTDLKGVEARIAGIDARLADLDRQIAAADQQVANRAAIPGVIIQPETHEPDIPPEAVILGGLGMAMVLLIPVSIAYARRIWRRAGHAAPAPIPSELTDRMASIERAVESVAIEVERIGEGQRFVTQLLNERSSRQALPVETERGKPL